MRKGQAQPIGEVIKSVVEKLTRAQKGGLAELTPVWPRVAGKEFAQHTKLLSLKKGTLLVGVDESAWLYQANLEKEKLLLTLQKKIGTAKIQKIQFRIGNLK